MTEAKDWAWGRLGSSVGSSATELDIVTEQTIQSARESFLDWSHLRYIVASASVSRLSSSAASTRSSWADSRNHLAASESETDSPWDSEIVRLTRFEPVAECVGDPDREGCLLLLEFASPHVR